MAFKSQGEFREVMDKVFTIMSTDPEMGPKLREAEAPQRFEFPDQDMVVNITFAPQVSDGQHLRWEWTDDVPWSSVLQLTMNSDVANRYFQGKENVAWAIARRKIRAAGDVSRALQLAPVTKPLFARYRRLVEREYPHLAV